MGVALQWRVHSARFVVCLQNCPSLSYVVRILTCGTGRQHSLPFGPYASRSGQRWQPASPSKPVSLWAQCDKEGSGSKSTGEFVVVATSTRKRKGNGVGKEPVWRSKRARCLPLHDASNGGDTCPEWCRGDDSLPARMQQACRHGRAISYAGPLARRRLLGLSARLLVDLLAWRLSGLLLSPFACLVALRLVSGVLAHCQLVCSLDGSLACRRHCGLSACCLLGGSLACQRRFGSFGGSLACLAAPWWQKGWWHAVSLHVFPNSLSFCRCCIVQIMSYALYFCFLGLLTLGAVPDVCTNNLRPVPFSFLSSFELGLLRY